jgi:hypothetical protein
LWDKWVAACEKGDKAATKVAAEAHDRAVPALKAAVKGWLLSRYGYSTEDTTVRVSKVLTRNFGPEMQYYPGPVLALPISTRSRGRMTRIVACITPTIDTSIYGRKPESRCDLCRARGEVVRTVYVA